MKCTPEEAFELAVKAGFAPPIRETDRYRFVRLIDLVRAIPKSEMREQFEQWYLQVFKDKDKTSEQETLRAMLQQMIEKVELSPATFEAAVYFRLGPAKSGERMASPRGAAEYPAFTDLARFAVLHNRRRAAAAGGH